MSVSRSTHSSSVLDLNKLSKACPASQIKSALSLSAVGWLVLCCPSQLAQPLCSTPTGSRVIDGFFPLCWFVVIYFSSDARLVSGFISGMRHSLGRLQRSVDKEERSADSVGDSRLIDWHYSENSNMALVCYWGLHLWVCRLIKFLISVQFQCKLPSCWTHRRQRRRCNGWVGKWWFLSKDLCFWFTYVCQPVCRSLCFYALNPASEVQ